MEIGYFSKNLARLQEGTLSLCRLYEQALRAAAPPFSFGLAGDCAMDACESRIEEIRRFVSRIEALEEENSVRRAMDAAAAAQSGVSCGDFTCIEEGNDGNQV